MVSVIDILRIRFAGAQSAAAAEAPTNRTIRHRVPPGRCQEMPKYFSESQGLIVTLRDEEILRVTLPAKVQSYMAAGKPILASADGEIANVIKESNAGFCAPADDVQGCQYP